MPSPDHPEEPGGLPGAADEPLPGLERHGVGPGAPYGSARPERLEGVDASEQGNVHRSWWLDGYMEWVEAQRRLLRTPVGPTDPYPLRGGELCDRCDELAMIATEHVWGHTSRDDDADPPPRWRSGVLLWCARHARENELKLLTDGAVVVGIRGDGPPPG